MTRLYIAAILFYFTLPFAGHAQQKVNGRVFDAVTRESMPFATIKFDEQGHGMVADLNGRFEVDRSLIPDVSWVEISYTGYIMQRVDLSNGEMKVYMHPLANALNEVVVKPPYDKIRHILNSAIARKNEHNPDKYDWYKCKVYYKMIVDMVPPAPAIADTTQQKIKFRDFLEHEHLLMSETYSIRTWKKPQQLQEDVIGSRFSGFKKSMFTSLVTDVLPFHSYSDYINLNGKDYHNPVSKGYEQNYSFDLADEIIEGADTIWILGFKPKGQNANELKGRVYINSDGYAISDLIASSADTILKRNVRLEQEYERVTEEGVTRWFPTHLNYIIDWNQTTKTKTGTRTIAYHMKGNSYIDSVSWKEQADFHFDKSHTVRLRNNADELYDSAWLHMRPVALDLKEQRTYEVVDSFGSKKRFDEVMTYMARLPEAKIPISMFDIDLKRFFSSNYYENYRLGAGLQTNERLLRWLSVGGWAGYGYKDAHWKYGLLTEVYADKRHEFVIKASYTDDINDPGRVHLNADLDKNYLNMYLLQRVDQVKTYSMGVKKKIDYLNLELTARQQEIIPKYAYALEADGGDHTTFKAQEVSLNLRYAFAERMAPFFGRYYAVGSKYPIWYAKITAGKLQSDNAEIPYLQGVTGVLWHKHVNRLGFEHFLLEGGISRSDGTLPLSKLFAGNGYRYDQSTGATLSLYTFGGFMTMYPYEYYTDRFASFFFRHDFDWKLYKVAIPGSSLSSAPFISLQYNVLYGKLQHADAQKYVTFDVPDQAYHEGGLLLNNLLRLNYWNLYYLTINTGYFYHIAPHGTGKFVVGAGVEF